MGVGRRKRVITISMCNVGRGHGEGYTTSVNFKHFMVKVVEPPLKKYFANLVYEYNKSGVKKKKRASCRFSEDRSSLPANNMWTGGCGATVGSFVPRFTVHIPHPQPSTVVCLMSLTLF